jgi:UDP:flavonoid glycosyltransferase YjiC (YdhE family)
MMRILFTTTAGMGHFHPLVPLAQAAVRAGHTVAFACPQSLCPYVEVSGFQAFSMIDLDSLTAERMAVMQRIVHLTTEESNKSMVSEMFIGIYARYALPELVALCRRWHPDIIVREEGEFGGAIAAEHLGLPHAAVQVAYASGIRFSIDRQRLDELRAAWGLPPDPTQAMLARYLFLSFDPPLFFEPATVVPPTMHHLRAEVFDRSSAETLPQWLAVEHARPLIYVTLGSEAPKKTGVFPAVYQSILAGLHDVAGTVVVTIGRDRDPAALGPQPDHVHVERYIPQSLLLPHCDLVVTHGGHNTVLAALQFGLPMVVVPLFADQFANAARCAALEVGRMIVGSRMTPERVRDTVQAILHDHYYRQQALRLQAEMRALPSVDYGVHLLEQLVAEHVPSVVGT